MWKRNFRQFLHSSDIQKILAKRKNRICFDFTMKYFWAAIFYTPKMATLNRDKPLLKQAGHEGISRCLTIIHWLPWKQGLSAEIVFLAKQKVYMFKPKSFNRAEWIKTTIKICKFTREKWSNGIEPP